MTSPNPSSPPPSPEGSPQGAQESAAKPVKPQPRPRHGGPPSDAEAFPGSGSATGFVSMLAKRQFDPDALAATASDEAARRERLHVARVIDPANEPKGAIARAAAEAEGPRWHKIALPVAVAMAVLLVAIGIWAVGALIYMHNVSPKAPKDVHYPLIAWGLEAGPMGDYTPASQFMAWMMLLCLPVAAMLIVMAYLLRQKTKELG